MFNQYSISIILKENGFYVAIQCKYTSTRVHAQVHLDDTRLSITEYSTVNDLN